MNESLQTFQKIKPFFPMNPLVISGHVKMKHFKRWHKNSCSFLKESTRHRIGMTYSGATTATAVQPTWHGAITMSGTIQIKNKRWGTTSTWSVRFFLHCVNSYMVLKNLMKRGRSVFLKSEVNMFVSCVRYSIYF